jgi:hypothetical protein
MKNVALGSASEAGLAYFRSAIEEIKRDLGAKSSVITDLEAETAGSIETQSQISHVAEPDPDQTSKTLPNVVTLLLDAVRTLVIENTALKARLREGNEARTSHTKNAAARAQPRIPKDKDSTAKKGEEPCSEVEVEDDEDEEESEEDETEVRGNLHLRESAPLMEHRTSQHTAFFTWSFVRTVVKTIFGIFRECFKAIEDLIISVDAKV